MAPIMTATIGPRRCTRKSDVVSPIPVVSTFVSENAAVTSGTLRSGGRGVARADIAPLVPAGI